MKITKLKVRAAKTELRAIKIDTDFIRLDSALKLADMSSTGGHAKIIIQDGGIRVNGDICTQRGKKLRPGDEFQYGKTVFRIEKNVY